jgi:hypothetical protein
MEYQKDMRIATKRLSAPRLFLSESHTRGHQSIRIMSMHTALRDFELQARKPLFTRSSILSKNSLQSITQPLFNVNTHVKEEEIINGAIRSNGFIMLFYDSIICARFLCSTPGKWLLRRIHRHASCWNSVV